jgi:glycosyltransferase involved in cell wall biosynthesis
LYSVYKGIGFLKRYIAEHNIHIVMPRSTMPSIMVNRLPKKFKILFDADGLPIEERVDFSGLSKNSRSYRFFKKEETKMLRFADGVITRSHKAIAIHQQTLQASDSHKFSVVLNGRNTSFFKPNDTKREFQRTLLGLSKSTKVFVYCGSLGPQYGWQYMLDIFQQYQTQHPDAHFLILTGNIEFAKRHLPSSLATHVSIKNVPFEEVPEYLNCADVAFALREPTFSMQGVAPIKLGEYLLMGIPTIASAGVGDSEVILEHVPHCFLFQHDNPNAVIDAVAFVSQLQEVQHEAIRDIGMEYFSIEKSAESYVKSFDKLCNICN